MHSYPEAYTVDNLVDILQVNASCPAITEDQIERIVDLAERRAAVRDEDAMHSGNPECLIGTTWTSFADDEFGRDDGQLNRFALGRLDQRASAGKAATLFTDAVVIQDTWLRTGDGRRTEVREYVDEEYDEGGVGDLWVPRGAQDYICIVELADELLFDSPTADDAM